MNERKASPPAAAVFMLGVITGLMVAVLSFLVFVYPSMTVSQSQTTPTPAPAANAEKPAVPQEVSEEVSVTNNREALIFEQHFGETRVFVSVFHHGWSVGQQRMDIGGLFIWRDQNGEISRVNDWRKDPWVNYERADLSADQLKWLEMQWTMYAEAMNLEALIPYYLANKPPLRELTTP